MYIVLVIDHCKNHNCSKFGYFLLLPHFLVSDVSDFKAEILDVWYLTLLIGAICPNMTSCQKPVLFMLQLLSVYCKEVISMLVGYMDFSSGILHLLNRFYLSFLFSDFFNFRSK